MNEFLQNSLYVLGVEVLVPLLVAMILGGLVGWNRELGDKPAGLKTHMMVALGAAAFTLVALRIFNNTVNDGMLSGSDPIRIVEGVATGIGFLGAGSIIRNRGEIQGITTAAGIWVVGGVGAACGARHFDIAVSATMLSLIILAVIRKVQRRVLRN